MKKRLHSFAGRASRGGQARLAVVLLVALVAVGAYGSVALIHDGATAPESVAAFERSRGLLGRGTEDGSLGARLNATSTGGSGTGFNDVALPGSSIVRGEPSVIVDSDGAIYVTGPTGVDHSPSISGSPLWKSTDGGQNFTGPVSTGTAGATPLELGGGDSDLVVDNDGAIFLTSLWLGNSQIAVSTDGGASFIASPISHITPVDDRPWLAYDPITDSLYLAWDGGDGLHVARAILRDATAGTPAYQPGSLVFAQDVIVVPQTAVGGTAVPDADGAIRQCVCAPGSIAVDPDGNVFVAYSHQRGMAVARSTDQGLTWTQTMVPNSATGSALDLGYGFQTLRSDGDGNLYVVWSVGPAEGPIQVYFSYLQKGGATWHAPIRVSTAKNALFATLATLPNRSNAVDIAYYGTDDAIGPPASAPSATKWNLYVAQSLDPLGGGAFTTQVALAGVHTGPIETAGISGSGDRSLGDFFGMVVDAEGLANIVTAVGNATNGTTIHFVRQRSAGSITVHATERSSSKKTSGATAEGDGADKSRYLGPPASGRRTSIDAVPSNGGGSASSTPEPFEGAAAIQSLPEPSTGPPVLLPLLLLSAFFVLGGGLAYRLKRR